ncbi:histidine triad nucleotide-binding protein [Aliarcobacter cibarius]|uniref:Histidine triad nucleotide-binding protein n=1 Tax=Aliarcobacter cibarius TaxID=255507 RepID=A0A5J6RGC0_9BACT|nr:histidine triad nucleotide-binding protein [Aliarcobacter cibarius]QEZ88437.1 histidine triad nucleotide-binding protein, Hint/PKCI branch [Aliarcobacter cibarius]QKJ26448.1 histidine triad nucleotide-binding protein, Hint/PKCI branch [Aliarcobacter cibarius]TLT01935.1 histidine triad nucleotide-binding protein [Aliarcobacter cibarius]TLT02270.1 histidine triad nucleotide-binding protein [Aliarcobacter cibarius]TLT04701.1 histidine triad nucleotide-binding protein [Aliarcobacter cibarius]
MCIFCKIVNKEIPSNIILEDENFLSFHDINPTRKVHALVIPKAHYSSFEDAPSSIMGSMSDFIKKVTKELNITESGYRMITNIGIHGGQEVPHLHFHIIGGESVGRLVREKNDL